MSGSGLSFYKIENNNTKPLPAEEQLSLFQKLKDGDQEAREKLILSNTGLVVSIARYYMTTNINITFEDLVQSGFVGILKAINTYKSEYNTKFSTHAIYWIRKEIIKTLQINSKPIQYTEYFFDILRRFIKAEKELEHTLYREPSNEELADFLHLSVDKVVEFKKYSYIYISLNDPDAFLNKIPSNDETSFDYLVLQEDMRKLLLILNDREREVIMRRFGLKPYQEKEFIKDIALSMNLSKGTIRETEKKALYKLRLYLEAAGMDMMCFI